VRKRSFIFIVLAMLIGTCAMPVSASAANLATGITVSADNLAAVRDGCSFGLTNFSRAMVGSNRSQDGVYYGYTYYTGDTADHLVAVFTPTDAIVYLPASQVTSTGFSPDNSTQLDNLSYLLQALDNANSKGGFVIDPNALTWHVTSDNTYTLKGVLYSFALEIKTGQYYTAIRGFDGSDITVRSNPLWVDLDHCDIADLVPSDTINIVTAPTGWAAAVNFFSTIDYSPLFVTLKTTGAAIVFIFILGLLAAYWLMHLPGRAQDIFDSIFTIPMVLPPTVCGFLLLLLLGRNTELGRFFIDIGFPLIFSWPATVIAAVVVAFPIMYRSARGAFENLDPDMLNAARTLGWSNRRIFYRLMLPLSGPSIAAGTVLAFARALGEFGATLFLAGNYVGVTQTIPIAIYFQWMNGNTDVAIFWTIIIILVSFVVIVCINIWSKRTSQYRRGGSDES
jgi:molybdate transport system permease protein